MLTSGDEAAVATAAGPVSTAGLALELPPAQLLGGGWNSALSAATVTLAQPLPPGDGLNVNFRLGVVRPGVYRFFINIEVLD